MVAGSLLPNVECLDKVRIKMAVNDLLIWDKKNMLIKVCKPVAGVTWNGHLKQMLTTCNYSTSQSVINRVLFPHVRPIDSTGDTKEAKLKRNEEKTASCQEIG
jgi:hypothetical protein